ncbi:PTS galactosamine/N-acetylgalactosamine transporter subunit IIA [Erysipelothrix urinaevulpis]|uniref:PTS galactosamine/N-acetylgalactosamine transporter subunit IIA n=1 Tax=Erysipelothrix urinaevulpis TaxID=2683717 RepID=UPI001358D557|nr:PTS galactosamine/N-acetylgalactosamine transporter subunit IIA [Erysipelothrix urinaevulpis]
MIGIVVVGHGEFANGLKTAVELIAGPQDSFEVLSFLEGEEHQLLDNLKQAIDAVSSDKGTLIFTDLKGGTPFRESVMVASQYEHCEVLTGTNLAMLIEAIMSRQFIETAKDLAMNAEQTGKDQVYRFVYEDLDTEENESDGI